jgi:starvation-inducible DNA-binding protein
MELHTGIQDKHRAIIAEHLNTLLADCYALYLKTQNYHWNVNAKEFFSLHVMFEKQYQDLEEAIDEIAERIRALGFYVDASFAAFKADTRIPDEGKVRTSEEMVKNLLIGHELVAREMRHLSSLAEKEGDFATVDMMGRRLNAHEKTAWMLRSHL